MITIRALGVANSLRQWGRALLPKGRIRTFLNGLLISVEKRRGMPYRVGTHVLRFVPGSQPDDGTAVSDSLLHLDAVQLRVFASLIERGDVVADVGAHLGEYTVVAAARVGRSGHVFAFEPVEGHSAVIARNLRMNKLEDRVTLASRVVSDRSETVSFFRFGDSSSNSLLRGAVDRNAADQLKEVRLQAVSLDDFFASHDRQPDVLKIDVEGAEFAVLRGAERIVRSHARIICELHPYAWLESGHDGEDLVAWLRERNRALIAIDSDEPVRDFVYGPVRIVGV